MTNMLSIPSELFLSSEVRVASNDAVVMYFVLRTDAAKGETLVARKAKTNELLESGLNVQTIAQRIGVPELAVTRLLGEITKRGWAKRISEDVYRLGEIKEFVCLWYLDSLTNAVVERVVIEIKPVEAVKHKLREDRSRIAAREADAVKIRAKLARDILGTVAPQKLRPKDVLNTFMQLYAEKYGMDAPLIEEGSRSGNPFATTYVYISRAIKWSKSVQEVVSVVKFMFENWSAIKAGLGLDGRPSFNLLGSSKLWPRLVCCMTEGIPKLRRAKPSGDTVAKRYDATDEGKKVGW